MLTRLRSFCGLPAIALLCACNPEFSSFVPPAIRVLRSDVASDSLVVGETIDLKIRLNDSVSARDFLLRVQWSSSDDSVIQVTPGDVEVDSLGPRLQARVRGLSHGPATVTVRVTHAPFDSVELQVPLFVRERWIAVSAGDEHTCALNSVHHVYCWGSGPGVAHPTGGNSAKPLRIRSIPSAAYTDLSSGFQRTCALAAPAAACWGSNRYGELGAGPYVSVVRSPTLMTGVREISIRRGVACGLVDNGDRASCWGRTALKSFGGSDDFIDVGIEECKQVAGEFCAYVVGANQFFADHQLHSLTVGDEHGCVIDRSQGLGQLFCWGRNDYAQVMFDDLRMIATDSLKSDYVAVSAGAYHTCGIQSDGGVLCWGLNSDGQAGPLDGKTCELLGLYDVTSVSCRNEAPVGLNVGTVVQSGSLSAGMAHTCAISGTGVAYCWGNNEWGQVGPAAAPQSCDLVYFFEEYPPERPRFGLTHPCRMVPAPVDTVLRFRQVSAGFGHTCGVTTAYAIYCWGANLDGQLGNGTMGGIVPTPARIREP